MPARAKRIGGYCAVLCGLSSAAQALDFAPIDGFDVRWETTLRETLGFRTGAQNQDLLSNVNGDDGDRAFLPGLNSARLDGVSEIDVSRGRLGFDISAEAWYDPVYYLHTANNSPATFNPVSVPNNDFPADVRRLMGGSIDLLNAYAHDGFTVGGTDISVRLGRQTLLWGESLFFPQNGIAAGQAPVDQIKALSQPTAEARELFLPVTQAVVRMQLRPGLALEAYDQFEWRPDRLPGVASYFSTSDVLGAGGERYLLPDGQYLARAPDVQPPGSGQFGVALRSNGATLDLGLYALRYDAKDPELVLQPARGAYTPFAGTYHLAYKRGIDVFGASISTYVGDSTAAGEISLRRGMPLVSGTPNGLAAAASGGAGGYASYAVPAAPRVVAAQAPAYAAGTTLHAQASFSGVLPPGRFWQGASVNAEIAANTLIAVTDGGAALAPRRHGAVSGEVVFSSQYFQVLRNLDITLNCGISYTLAGNSAVQAAEVAGAGNATVAVAGVYRSVWQTGVSFTHYIGGAGAQALADRDFALVTLSRSF
jgi:hypothetical protein